MLNYSHVLTCHSTFFSEMFLPIFFLGSLFLLLNFETSLYNLYMSFFPNLCLLFILLPNIEEQKSLLWKTTDLS